MLVQPDPRHRPPAPRSFTGPELGEAALRGFFMIAEAWGLSTAEQLTLLGAPSRSTFFAWKKAPGTAISKDTMERISYLLGIWKALRILIPDDPQALAWVKKPNGNPLFGGQPPLARMLQGRILDLADVRRLLDARRGVW
jgi:hypothetical protein